MAIAVDMDAHAGAMPDGGEKNGKNLLDEPVE